MAELITLPRATVQQALEALENSSPDQYPEDAGVFYDAKDALKAALEQPEQCSCGDRLKDQCPGEWEPGCDLGNNPQYARRVNLPRGCGVCGLGSSGEVTGYVCQRTNCPTRVTCGGTL
jgi:hypothetical protein